MEIDKKIKRLIQRMKVKRSRKAEKIREISYETLKRLMKENRGIIIVDVRSPQEFAEGRIKTAINIPLYDLNKKAKILLPNKDSLIILYCACGIRSEKGYEILEEKGYSNIYTLKDGLDNII